MSIQEEKKATSNFIAHKQSPFTIQNVLDICTELNRRFGNGYSFEMLKKLTGGIDMVEYPGKDEGYYKRIVFIIKINDDSRLLEEFLTGDQDTILFPGKLETPIKMSFSFESTGRYEWTDDDIQKVIKSLPRGGLYITGDQSIINRPPTFKYTIPMEQRGLCVEWLLHNFDELHQKTLGIVVDDSNSISKYLKSSARSGGMLRSSRKDPVKTNITVLISFPAQVGPNWITYPSFLKILTEHLTTNGEGRTYCDKIYDESKKTKNVLFVNLSGDRQPAKLHLTCSLPVKNTIIIFGKNERLNGLHKFEKQLAGSFCKIYAGKGELFEESGAYRFFVPFSYSCGISVKELVCMLDKEFPFIKSTCTYIVPEKEISMFASEFAPTRIYRMESTEYFTLMDGMEMDEYLLKSFITFMN